MNEQEIKLLQLSQCNKLLLKVTQESANEEAYVAGLLNIVAICRTYGFTLMLGQVPLEAFSHAYPTWWNLFSNKTVFTEIGKHLYIQGVKYEKLKDMRFATSSKQSYTNFIKSSSIFPDTHERKSLHANEHNRELTKLGTYVIGVDRKINYIIDRDFNVSLNINYGSAINTEFAGIKLTMIQGKVIFQKLNAGNSTKQSGVEIKVDVINERSIPVLYLAFLFGKLQRVRDLYLEQVDVHTFITNIAISIVMQPLFKLTNTEWAIPKAVIEQYSEAPQRGSQFW